MIRLENVTKVYEGGTVAARDVSLDIQRGEFVFLVGSSGSGKSTLIRLMLRQEPLTRGTIWVAGKDITALPSWKVPYLRRSIGTVFQDFKLLPTKTVFENVAFALEVIGRPRGIIEPQVQAVLEMVGLADMRERLPRQLSGGEQQRVSIARAFVNRPPILLADEPTGNLDPQTSIGIMKLLDRINKAGTTVVMATHAHFIVDAMKRRVVAIDSGEVVRDEFAGRYEDHVAAVQQAADASTPVATAPDLLPPPENSEQPVAQAAADTVAEADDGSNPAGTEPEQSE